MIAHYEKLHRDGLLGAEPETLFRVVDSPEEVLRILPPIKNGRGTALKMIGLAVLSSSAAALTWHLIPHASAHVAPVLFQLAVMVPAAPGPEQDPKKTVQEANEVLAGHVRQLIEETREAGARGDRDKMIGLVRAQDGMIDPDAKGSYCMSLLMQFARHTDDRDFTLGWVKYLVSRGANVGARDDFGRTVLMHAANAGRPDIVRFLVEDAGANVLQKDFNGRTAIDYVQASDESGIARYLANPPATGASKSAHGPVIVLLAALRLIAAFAAAALISKFFLQ